MRLSRYHRAPMIEFTPTEKTRAGIERAIEVAGSQSELARIVDRPRQTVHQWVAIGMIPHQHLDVIVAALPELSKKELRPDIFDDDMPAIERTVFISGGIKSLSDKLGVKYPTVRAWAYGEAKVPPRFCKRLSELTDAVVHPHDLRPDVFTRYPHEY